jgi:hypothetical protein
MCREENCALPKVDGVRDEKRKQPDQGIHCLS